MGIRVAKFFLQNFLTVLRNFPSKQNITANRYYGSCQRNEYIFSKYFGHPTTFISVIFLPKLETNSDLQNLFLTHSTLNACGENPTYIFLIPSLLNSTMTEEIPLTRSTSKIFVIHGDDRNGKEILKIFVICLPCRVFSMREVNPFPSDDFLDST